MVVAMGQIVPKIDDVAHFGNPTGEIWMIRIQAIDRFTDDLELAFDCGLRPRIGRVGGAVHAVNEQLYVGTRLINVRQQDSGVTSYKQVRGIR